MTSEMINLTIDGRAVSVPKGTTVYHAATQMGIDLPIFCYQDRMPPFGACRVCLVEVEKMPKLQTSCTLEATQGMVVHTQNSRAIDGRKSILELLLINHPLDCPICDKGGECPLQDQTLKFGPGQSRFYEEKRHFVKPKPLGPVLMLDRERCIVCARCTRFGDEVAGDHALEFIDRGFRTEVGTPGDAPAKSKFIGNTIAICPVGALTSQVYRFRARPWDNHHTPSTCTLCPVGCSMTLDSRDGEIMRTRSCENKDLNDIWLCDKGWFGYEFIDHPERLQKPLVRRNGNLEPASWEEALALVASKMEAARPGGKVAGFGGNHLTTEENYLFQKLIREGVGVNHLDHRIGMPIMSLEEEGLPPGMEMSIGECEQLSYAVLMGVDLTEEFPVIWLRLKQAINKGAKVIFIGNYAPEISKHLEKTILHSPGATLDELKKFLPEVSQMAADGKKGALFVGRQYLDTPQRRNILSELLKVRQATPNLSLNILEGRGNSVGARLAGMRPDVGPLGEQVVEPGLNALQVLEKAASEGWDYLHVAGADPAAKFPAQLWQQARAKLGFLVVQELFMTETAKQADVVLPALCFVEKEGSFVNIEGRIQKLKAGKDLPFGIYSDADIFTLIGLRINVILTNNGLFTQALHSEERLPLQRPSQVKAGVAKNGPSQSMVATFAPALFDEGIRMQHNLHLKQMVEKPYLRVSPVEGAKYKLQDEQKVRVKINGNSIEGQIKFDKGVAEGTVVLPLGFTEVPVHNLAKQLINGLSVELG